MALPTFLRREVNAVVGKRLRAEPIAQLYELGRVHHGGEWPTLEDQMPFWVAGMDSPDRMTPWSPVRRNSQEFALQTGAVDQRLAGRR